MLKLMFKMLKVEQVKMLYGRIFIDMKGYFLWIVSWVGK